MPDLILGRDWLGPVHSAPGHSFGADTQRGSITGVLPNQAALYGNAPFLTDLTGSPPQTVTWEAANAEVARRASALAGWGLRRGERVGILGQNSVDFALAVLAVLEAGGVGVLLNHRDPASRIDTRAEFTGVRFLLHDRASEALAEACKSVERTAALEELGATTHAQPWSPVTPAPTDAALIFFTSGTTGNPKAVVQSHYAVAQNAWSLAQHHGIGPGQSLLCVLPLHHVNGLEFTVFAALVGGGHTSITRGLDVFNFWSLVEEHETQIVSLVPNLLRLLADRSALRQNRGRKLRYAVSAAAPLSTGVASHVRNKLDLRVVQGYGLSEVTNFSCLMPPAISDSEYEKWMLSGNRTSIGPALPGQEVQVLGTSGFAGPEEQGEIVIRGHCVMSGYLHNEGATRTAFEGGWFHTGDLGYFLTDAGGRKFFHVAGRIREIAKRSGAMVNLLEVDEVLMAIPGVADAAAAAFPNQWVDEEIGAVIVREEECGLGEEEILARCREILPFAETPKVIRFVDQVPRTATGKVRRGEVASLFHGLEDRIFPERRTEPRPKGTNA